MQCAVLGDLVACGIVLVPNKLLNSILYRYFMTYSKGFMGMGMLVVLFVVLVVGGAIVYDAKKTPTSSSNIVVSNNSQVDQITNSITPTSTQNQNRNSSSTPEGTPMIAVISPNGGERWSQNGEYVIRWTYSGLDKNDQIRIGFRSSDASICWIGTSSIGSDLLKVTPNKINCSGDVKSLKIGDKYKVQLIVTKYDSGLGVAAESDNYFTITPPIITTQIYNNTQFGFEVAYPAGWQVLPPVGTLARIAFGETEHIGKQGYDGDWFIFVYSDSETNIDNMRKSLGEEVEQIFVNGLPALRLVKGQYESILIKTAGKNYWIHNGNSVNGPFSDFYNSFKLI